MRWGRVLRILVLLAVVMVLSAVTAVAASVGWVRLASMGHLHTVFNVPNAADASHVPPQPWAPVVIVPGAQLAGDRVHPLAVLRNRLDTAAALMAAGHAQRVLVSGDAHGGSGDETAAMTGYLIGAGLRPGDIDADHEGVDTHTTCVRAYQVFGVRRALVVTQGFHLPRAVALCRAAGIDAEGVVAGCEGCRRVLVWWNTGRDWLAAPKAVGEVLADRLSGRLSDFSSGRLSDPSASFGPWRMCLPVGTSTGPPSTGSSCCGAPARQ
jgi:SanA protein